MLTLRFIGFFRIIRKCYIDSKLAMARPFTRSCLLLPLYVFTFSLLAVFLTDVSKTAQAQIVSEPEEEPGQAYFGRDADGNRVFGTDDKSPAGFYTEPESGERQFRTAPPPKENNAWDNEQPIWITPEIKPGQPNRPGVWPPSSNRPGNRPNRR